MQVRSTCGAVPYKQFWTWGVTLQSLPLMIGWSIWNLCNRCVFDGVSPSLSLIMVQVRDELKLWGLAGARGSGISYLTALAPEEG